MNLGEKVITMIKRSRSKELVTICMILTLTLSISGCMGKKVKNNTVNETAQEKKESVLDKTQEESFKEGNGEFKDTQNTDYSDCVHLLWYQIGDAQTDLNLVLEEVNKYISKKIGATLTIKCFSWEDYTRKMQVIINAGQEFDLAFTSSWTNDYLTNVKKGAFLSLDEYLNVQGKEMLNSIEETFWEAMKVGNHIYGVPSEKEIGNMPMWVFTKEYVDKYNIPYQEIHTLEDLEPWLKLIKENEPDVVPFYVTGEYSVPIFMDLIQTPIGVEYDDQTLTVKNAFETKRMKTALDTMRRYYLEGYINKDAAMATDDKNVTRFVTKGDGQPYAEKIWTKDLGYEVVSSNIMDTYVTTTSARGAITAVSSTSKHPDKAVELLNLINTDEYVRNLLNYGIENIHYTKVKAPLPERLVIGPREKLYDVKIKINQERQRSYSVPYWVQGGLFNTYVLTTEPIDKWNEFRIYNNSSQRASTFGFAFDSEKVLFHILELDNVMGEFVAPLYTGSVDPMVYVPKLNKKLKEAGIDKVIEEAQRQLDEWKRQK